MFFMLDSISWVCQEGRWAERLLIRDLDFLDDFSWLALLETYSRKRITRHDDRLYAVAGIVEFLQRAKVGNYHHEYGVWDDNIGLQLLWRQPYVVHAHVSSTLPTWSWAAMQGPKRWPVISAALSDQTKSLNITADGSLATVGYLITQSAILQSVPCEVAWRICNLAWHNVKIKERRQEQRRTYLIFDKTQPRSILGTAAFDHTLSTSAAFFILVSDRSGQSDPPRLRATPHNTDQPMTVLDSKPLARVVKSFDLWRRLSQPVESGSFPHALSKQNWHQPNHITFDGLGHSDELDGSSSWKVDAIEENDLVCGRRYIPRQWPLS